MPSHNRMMHWAEKHQRPMMVGAGVAVAQQYGMMPSLGLPPIVEQGAIAWALNKQKNKDAIAGMVGGTVAVFVLGMVAR